MKKWQNRTKFAKKNFSQNARKKNMSSAYLAAVLVCKGMVTCEFVGVFKLVCIC